MSTTTQNPMEVHLSELGGHAIAELAQTYGTPTYFYDASVIRQRIADLKRFDVIRYAQKANSNLAILDLVRRQGCVVDAVSPGEVYRAEQAGFNPGLEPGCQPPGSILHGGSPANVPAIVYTADIFDRAALEMVVQQNIHVNAGSADMIEQLGQQAPGRSITLRINPGFGHGHSAKTNTGGPSSKHGIWHEELPGAIALAQKYSLSISGLHIHIGSGTDFEHLSQVCQAMESLVAQVGVSIRSISAGGGLPTPYRSTDQPIDIQRYFELWDASRKRMETHLGHPISLEIEPGRFLVAESGYLVTEIRAIKKMGENLFYLVDAGFNNLARPILYGAYHPMAIAARGTASSQQQAVIVGGPLCESGDIFTQEEGGFVRSRELPTAQIGDLLVIGCAGAYGAVMSSNYNGKPFAAEVLLDADRHHLIRQRQSLPDLIRGERIPEWA